MRSQPSEARMPRPLSRGALAGRDLSLELPRKTAAGRTLGRLDAPVRAGERQPSREIQDRDPAA